MSLPDPAPDRAVVVTGASSGIGAEIARELHRRGHQVVLVAPSADRLEALAAELGEGRARPAVDLSDRPSRAVVLDRVAELGCTPNILVNNAGLSTVGPVAASDPDAEMKVIEVDLAAVADLRSRFLPGMIERGRGAVLNVASTARSSRCRARRPTVPARRSSCPTRTASPPSYAAPASPRRPCARARSTPASARPPASPRTRRRPRCRPSCGQRGRPSTSAVEGLAHGRLVVIPATADRVAAMLAQLTPRTLLLPILARNHPGLK